MNKSDPIVQNPELREALLAMREIDQDIRKRLVADWNNDALGEEMSRIDRENTQKLRKLIADHGWPDDDVVGKDGCDAAWILVQHADHDVEFQEQCYGLLEQAVERDRARRTHLAYLYDRIAVNRGQLQRFGTQFGEGLKLQPVEAPESLDARRLAVGLSTMAEYEKHFMEYAAPTLGTDKNKE